MWKIFESCESLQNLNLLIFNTQNVEDMSQMFSNWIELSDLQFNFNIIKVNYMNKMFIYVKNYLL